MLDLSFCMPDHRATGTYDQSIKLCMPRRSISLHPQVDVVPRDQLFKVICCGFSAVFIAIASVLQSSTYGLYGQDGQALPASSTRLVGWIHYFAIESYGQTVAPVPCVARPACGPCSRVNGAACRRLARGLALLAAH
eukprot:6190713-Pleurochrysis_carterae.AAC.2